MTLPTGWATAAIRELVVEKVDQAPPTEPVSYIDIGSIDRDRKVVGEIDEVDRTTAPTRARQWVRTGDVLVSMTRPNLNAVAFVPGRLSGAVASTGFDVLRAIGVLPEWLFARVRTREFVNDICEGVQGVVYPAVRPEDVRRHQMPVAPLAEQRRIVDAIDSHLSRLDAAVESLERAKAKLKAYRASVLKAAVEGKLVPTEAELARREKRDYEPAQVLLDRILKERRRRWEDAELARLKKACKLPKDDKWKNRYKELAAPNLSELPALPEGWCWATVDQVAADAPNSLCDGPFGSNLKTAHYTSSGPRVVRLQNIGDGEFLDAEAHISQTRFDLLKKHAVVAADIVVASLGTDLPRAALVPGWLGPAIVKADCLRLSVDSGLAEAGFIMHALNAAPMKKRVERLVHGVGRPRIGLTLFRETALPLPPFGEQALIAEEVSRLFSVTRTLLEQVDIELLRVGLLRQSILKWAFDGRLVDQDPNDEPAEQLLSRILAGKTSVAAPKKARRGAAKSAKPQTGRTRR